MSVKLSPKQEEVMSWLRNGHRAYIEGVSVVYINGKKVCNLDTMAALERRGLIVRSGQWGWEAARSES